MTEQLREQQDLDRYAYYAEKRYAEPRTLEHPYSELRGDSVEDRRKVQIENLKFRLEHAQELGLWPAKIDRMQIELDSLEFAQLYPDPSIREWMFLGYITEPANSTI